MRESPLCPTCTGLIAGVSRPNGGRRGRAELPNASTGYCMTCHISLTKSDGAWARSRVAPLL